MSTAENFVGQTLRKSQNVVMDGERKSLFEWTEFYNISYHVVYGRIKAGWEIRKALTDPVQKVGANLIGAYSEGDEIKKTECEVSPKILDARK